MAYFPRPNTNSGFTMTIDSEYVVTLSTKTVLPSFSLR